MEEDLTQRREDAKRYGRPGMYLMPFEKKVDAASFFLNCLIAVFDSHEFSSPQSVCLTVTGQNFHMQAVGGRFEQFVGPTTDLAAIFDIENHKTPFFDDWYALGFLRPVIWLAEYSMVDVTVAGYTSRQSFLYGEPVGQEVTFAGNSEQSGFGVHFTLPVKSSEDVTLPIERLERAVTAWEKQGVVPNLPGDVSRPVFHKEWCKLSTNHYSLQMITTTNGSYTKRTTADNQFNRLIARI